MNKLQDQQHVAEKVAARCPIRERNSMYCVERSCQPRIFLRLMLRNMQLPHSHDRHSEPL